MKCKKCGWEGEENELYRGRACPECGLRKYLAKGEEETGKSEGEINIKRCSECGAELESDANFCIECGAKLTEEQNETEEVLEEPLKKKAPRSFGEKLTKKEKGQSFEELVSEIFESQGYEVAKNLIEKGKSGTKHEIDILADFQAALHESKIAIECKAHQKPIPKDTVMKLKDIANDIGADKGIVVSKSGFTSGAESYARDNNIELWGPEKVDRERVRLGKPDATSEMTKKVYKERKPKVTIKNVDNNFSEYGKKFNVNVFFDVKNKEPYRVRGLKAKVQLLSRHRQNLDMKEMKLGDIFPNSVENYKCKLKPLASDFIKKEEEGPILKIRVFNREQIFDEDTIRRIKHPTPSKCFIATAAYGTPYAKDIDILRRFRDDTLIHMGFGKGLVNLYYRTSPSLANAISKSENLRTLIRNFLIVPIVRSLRQR